MEKTLELRPKSGGKIDITTVRLDPFAAYLLLNKLGPVLLTAIAAGQGGIATAADAVFKALSPDMQQSLALDLLQQTYVVRPDADGKLERIELNSIAKINRGCGSLKVMLLAMKHSLEVNYGDFFDDSDGLESLIPMPSD